ncbi:hypothetical protein [Streptomyces sp. bgisy034]|uniref:hypothetical protein n=1 Tax=Streptomyces sp. bgisy034 TaxID=3413774 RepID=UPI003EB94B41
MPVTKATIRAVTELTARRAQASDAAAGDGTVFSAAGAWPPLAFLADGADGPARTEPADGAVGLPADDAAGTARELLGATGTMRGLDSALGLRTKRTLQLRERWEAGLPAEAHGVLTGDPAACKGALDAWAVKRTRGPTGEMPVAPAKDTEMVPARAPAMRTNWLRRFWGHPVTPETGPWVDRDSPRRRSSGKWASARRR